MVGYIFLSNRARWWEKKLNIIITTKFKEYYIYEISNLNRRCVEKLRKLIKKDNIKQVACEEEIQQYVDKKILIDEKDIIKYLILEILEYIFEIQGKKMEQEDIYFLINKDEDIYLENIKTLSEKFKTTNIITEELSKFQKIVENIFEDGQWAILEWKDPLGLRGCGFFQVVNGKILFQRGYWDKLSFLKQHNLPVE